MTQEPVQPSGDQAAPPPAKPGPSKRNRALGIFGILLVIVASIGFAYWLFIARHRETTDDAYVNGNIVSISSQNAGTVLAINADDTGMVKAGDIIIRLDPSDAQLEVEQAEATLVSEVRAVRQLFVEVERDRGQIAAINVDALRAREDLARRTALSTVPGAVTDEEVSHARSSLAQVEANNSIAQATLQASLAAVDGTTVRTHPRVVLAASHLRQALLDLERTRIVAPVSGIVDKRSVQVGQRIQSGQSLMAIIPIAQMWIDANFKESQLREVTSGQPVDLTSDLYGSSVVFHGWVIGMGAGTGAAFSLLPAQNASGNWIKIVQRLPVRIGLNPDELNQHPLRIGLSMSVKVRINEPAGALPAAVTGQSIVYQTSNEATLTPEIDKTVDAIIAKNLSNDASSSPTATAAPAAGQPGESTPAAHP